MSMSTSSGSTFPSVFSSIMTSARSSILIASIFGMKISPLVIRSSAVTMNSAASETGSMNRLISG